MILIFVVSGISILLNIHFLFEGFDFGISGASMNKTEYLLLTVTEYETALSGARKYLIIRNTY